MNSSDMGSEMLGIRQCPMKGPYIKVGLQYVR